MIKAFVVRFLALLLYTKEIKALKYCFTITLFIIFLIYNLDDTQKISITSLARLLVKPICFYIITFLVSYRVLRGVAKIKTFVRMLLLSVLAAACILLFKINKVSENIQKVQSSTNSYVQLEGYIESVEGSKSILKEKRLNLEKVLVKESNVSVLQPGLYCKISGYLVEPESFEEFDYKGYLKHKGIYSILNAKEIECSEKGFNLKRMRYWIEDKYKRVLPEPYSSLLVGILLGSNQEFTKTFEENIRSAGVSHIIAASGYNISILLVVGRKIFSSLNKKLYLISSLLLIWSFTFLSGLAPSLLRATVMSSMYLLSNMFGRKASGAVILIYALVLLAIVDPYILFDIGFLLSFASTLSLTLFLPCIEKYSESKFLKTYLFPTVSCTLFALPISMYYFKTVSVVSIITNMLVLPILEQTLLWGLLIIPTYSFTNFFVNGTYIQLKIFILIVELMSKINVVSVEFNPVVVCLAIYFLLGIFILYRYPVANIKKNFYVKKALNFFK
jgi:competence protein ComEC